MHGKNFIGFSLSSMGNDTFASSDRFTNADGTVLFHDATENEIDAAAKLASEAFLMYSKLGGIERARFLDAVVEEINAVGDELLNTASRETGLPVARITGERQRTNFQITLFATLIREGSWVNAIIDSPQPDRTPVPRPGIRQMQFPLGPVAVFGASNFPLAFSVAGGDTVSALASGCTVIFKAHPAHPETCELVGAAIIAAAKKTQMPDGVFSMLHGKSTSVGQKLIRHPNIKAVGFTGSFGGGKAIFDEAVKRPEPIPVFAEMSSINPVVFLPEILEKNADAIAAQFADSIVLGGGQFCTNPGICLLLKGESGERFFAKLSDVINGKPEVPMLSDAIAANYSSGISRLRKVNGIVTLTDFKENGCRPHIIRTDVETVLKEPLLLHEYFGPSSVCIVADTLDEMMRCIRHFPGQLTATIHGTEKELISYAGLIELLRAKAGRVLFNGFPTGVEVGYAMVHGGPFPATTDSRSTSVGTQAIYRFTRPVCFQNCPEPLLPAELQSDNPLRIARTVDGKRIVPEKH
jgi:2,5-dioxopentanoate dehydrogenase